MFKHLLLASSLMLNFACVTKTPRKKTPKSQVQSGKTGKKSTALTQKSEEPSKSPSVMDLRRVNLASFVLRLSSPSVNFTPRDRQVAEALKADYKPGTFGEAAFAVSLVHLVALQPENSPTIPNEPASIESMSKSKGFNFLGAFENNPALQTYGFYSLVQQTMTVGNNSQEFRENMQAVIDRQASKWSGLKVIEDNFDQQNPTPAPEAPTPVAKGGILPAMTFGASDLRSDDTLLQEASQLAVQGNYSKAIEILHELKEDSPLFVAAQEKILECSNQAVRILRRKAAMAYQSSIPVADPKARAAYLEKAKGHLEKALNDFPKADQLGVVKENLAVINRDLQRLQSPGTASN